jgi:exonuclease III
MYSPEQHHLNNLPQLDLIEVLNSRNNISNLDPDLNIPSQSNFQYYTTDEFQTNDIINECISSDHFSCLHSNIRSLNSNFDNLIQMLSEFSYNFSVIGLTETRLKTTQENLCNQYLNGYTFVSQPSLSNAGGVGFFINDSLCYNVRHDLSEIVAGYETLWIEIQSSLINQNIICGVIYRHPHSDISTFMTYLNNTLDRINNEQKLCVLMGDFNLNLLNWDSHSPTEEF